MATCIFDLVSQMKRGFIFSMNQRKDFQNHYTFFFSSSPLSLNNDPEILWFDSIILFVCSFYTVIICNDRSIIKQGILELDLFCKSKQQTIQFGIRFWFMVINKRYEEEYSY